jgi:hypothetical protein
MAITATQDLSSQSLTQIFNESAARYYEAFPEQLKKLLVISQEEQIYASPDITGLLTKNVAAVKNMIATHAQYMRDSDAEGLAGPQIIGRDLINCISLDTNSTSASAVSGQYPREMNRVFTFDHEMGHLVVKEGSPGPFSNDHMTECAADAFATLRHVQRSASALPRIFLNTPLISGHIRLFSRLRPTILPPSSRKSHRSNGKGKFISSLSPCRKRHSSPEKLLVSITLMMRYSERFTRLLLLSEMKKTVTRVTL